MKLPTQTHPLNNSRLHQLCIQLAVSAVLLLVCGCASQPQHDSLFLALGGNDGIARISRNFIREIGGDPETRRYFKDTNLKRFHAKFSQHLCQLSGGPCDYSGEESGNDMPMVHSNMNISEKDFNRTVDLLINAMNSEKIPHPTQNRLLKVLAPMYGDIVYQ